jgi:hypothetical protein
MPVVLGGPNKMYIMTGATGCGGSMMMRGTIALMLGVERGGCGEILARDVDDNNNDDACIDRCLLAMLRGLRRHGISNDAGILVVVRVDAFPDEAAARVGLEPVRADGHPRPSRSRNWKYLPGHTHALSVVRLNDAAKLSSSTAAAGRRTNIAGKMREGGMLPRWTFLGSPEAVGSHHLPVVIIVVVGRR